MASASRPEASGAAATLILRLVMGPKPKSSSVDCGGCLVEEDEDDIDGEESSLDETEPVRCLRFLCDGGNEKRGECLASERGDDCALS